MSTITLLFCISFIFGQTNSPAPEQKAQSATSSSDGLCTGAHGQIDILSDTQGSDFGPYLQRVVQEVRKNWYKLIPESVETRQGKLAIEFHITKDGKPAEIHVVASSGDVALDRPAWASIIASNPFPPLPSELTGPYLALRFCFYYNPSKFRFYYSGEPSKSGVTVSIFSTSDGLRVPVGGTDIVVLIVMGAKDDSVEWTVSGSGCAGSACGHMIGNVYVAPSVPPNPPEVTLTAVSKADPTAKASVIVHIVERASKTASKP